MSRELLPKNLRPSTSDLEDADKENSELENSDIVKCHMFFTKARPSHNLFWNSHFSLNEQFSLLWHMFWTQFPPKAIELVKLQKLVAGRRFFFFFGKEGIDA